MFAFGLLLAACHNASSDGAMVIRNDIQDSECNQITIDEVQTSAGKIAFRKILSPGEEVAMPAKIIKRFTVTRNYKDLGKVYVVTCPAKAEPILIKLIDIHLNRLPGGCILTRVGEKKGGIIRWSD